jgi:streptogramin lyase
MTAAGGTLAELGRVDTSGNITESALPPGDAPAGITIGSDGNIWYDTMIGTNQAALRGVSPSTRAVIGSSATFAAANLENSTNSIFKNPANGDLITVANGQVWRAQPGSSPTVVTAFMPPSGFGNSANTGALGTDGNIYIEYTSLANSSFGSNVLAQVSQSSYNVTVISQPSSFGGSTQLSYSGPIVFGPKETVYCWGSAALPIGSPTELGFSPQNGLVAYASDGSDQHAIAEAAIMGPDGRIWISAADILAPAGSLLAFTPF